MACALTSLLAINRGILLQYKGCAALCNLGGDKASAQSIGRQGGVAVVIKALRACGTDVHIASKALKAMFTLCMTRENFSELLQHESVGSVVDVMHRHAQDEDVQAKACMVLNALCKVAGNLDEIIAEGGVEALCQAVMRVPHSEQLLVDACCALAVLALKEDAMTRIMQTSVMRIIRVAIKGTFASSQALLTVASRLERALAPAYVLVTQREARDTCYALASHDTSKVTIASARLCKRRPISATVTASRPLTRSANEMRMSATMRPASATNATLAKSKLFSSFDSRSLSDAGETRSTSKDTLRDSLKLQHQILVLKKEAETLRKENLKIMADAVGGMAGGSVVDFLVPGGVSVNVEQTVTKILQLRQSGTTGTLEEPPVYHCNKADTRQSSTWSPPDQLMAMPPAQDVMSYMENPVHVASKRIQRPWSARPTRSSMVALSPYLSTQ
jgi:hypothetical protein